MLIESNKNNLTKFQGEVLDKIEHELFNLDEDILHNKATFLSKYENQMRDILNDMLRSKIGTLGVIVIVLSRVNIDNENFSYVVFLYGEKLYIDIIEKEYTLDVSDVYKYFMNAKKYLYQNVKKYIGLYETCNVDVEMYQYLKYFNMYIVSLLRDVFIKSSILSLVDKLKKTNTFYVIQNEIYEKPYLIYKRGT